MIYNSFENILLEFRKIDANNFDCIYSSLFKDLFINTTPPIDRPENRLKLAIRQELYDLFRLEENQLRFAHEH